MPKLRGLPNGTVFLSQSVDHALVLLLAILPAGLFWLSLPAPRIPITSFGAAFWCGLMGALFVIAFGLRLLCLSYLGATPGQLLLRISIRETTGSRDFWRALVLESLQPALPALWVLDHLSRNYRGRGLGWNYQ